MHLDDFDFELPQSSIALRPHEPRDEARLLEVLPGQNPSLQDRRIGDIANIFRKGDVLVLNNTKVISAALTGTRTRDGSTATISVNLHKKCDQATWKAFAKPARRLKLGDRINFGTHNNACELGALDAVVSKKGEGGEMTLTFDLAGADLELAIEARGAMPLPPYIASKRAPDERDQHDYQTVFAKHTGAVAAPTAGLHFTDELLARLSDMGVARQFVTLHVGAGTFLPVKSDDLSEHKMHAEWGEISAQTARALNKARANGGRIIAVGTTSMRLLESAADSDGQVQPFCDETDIFITPGYRFRAVDLLMTNFHLPRSTLFMLVSAFSGLPMMQQAYSHAINTGYRFYSYGDACLLHCER